MRLSGIEFSKAEPRQKNVLWIRPISLDAVALYLFRYGKWVPFKTIDDKGTSTVSDDVVASISNINQAVIDEVSRQLHDHDISVRDVHSSASGDEGDYPDVTILG